jgi:release factor glutamine methyltransferase
VLAEAGARLSRVADEPAREARLLASHVVGRPVTWVLAHPDFRLSSEQTAELERLIAERAEGEPLPYLLGHWEFYGLDFALTPDVLIPRPETELLVATAIAWAQGRPTVRAADLGTGSGCIAISLAVGCPQLTITATDISPAALGVARRNAGRHGVAERISFVECDLFPAESLPSYDLIVSNPPYIPTDIMKRTAVYGKEPALAIDGGQDGLALISRVLEGAPARLTRGGMLLVEIEAGLGNAVLTLAAHGLPHAEVALLKDLAGLDRLLVVKT